MNEESLIRPSEPQNYLLVEGKDDEHVFYSLLEHYKVPERFKIRNKESVTNLLETLNVELARSGLERLGIVVDANSDIQARWLALRNRLIQSGYNTVPETPGSSGTIIEENERPVVGIWLMPDNKISGMLEDFISFLVPQGDVLWPIAEDTLQRVIGVERRFREAYISKVHIHTWLAWQKEPGKPLGQAITAKYLDASVPHAQQLIHWIRKLFDLEMVST